MTTAANGHRSYGHRVVQIGPGHYRLFWTGLISNTRPAGCAILAASSGTPMPRAPGGSLAGGAWEMWRRKAMRPDRSTRSCSWKGRVQRRRYFALGWPFIRSGWGRMCYLTNCHGDTLDSWFEWEDPANGRR